MEFIKVRSNRTHFNQFIRKNISVEIANPLSYFVFGKRFINIIHTKLRFKCILHYDLYRHMGKKDVHHLFFACKKKNF